MGLLSESSLTPGFRFHPTDEELVCFYLKRKVSGNIFHFEPIAVIDIYKYEPWDLPDKSKLKTRDLEWYFFSALDKKYGNSSRTNRVTEKGYWKTTGKDREVRHNSRRAGMKKTLVYHSGRAPRGARTNWVMHEYRLVDEELGKKMIFQDSFVLCRIFQKSGSGPKNGENYGAPFVEEEWEDDAELLSVPGQEAMTNEELANEDVHGEVDDFKQNDEGVSSENAQVLLSSFYHGETSTEINQLNDFVEDDNQKLIIDMAETSKLWDDLISEMHTEDFQPNGTLVGDNSIAESNGNSNTKDVYDLVDEPDLNVPNNMLFDDGLFLETDDLSNQTKVDSTGFDLLDDYLAFFDADGDNSFMSFDPSEIFDSEEFVSDPASLADNLVNGEVDHTAMVSKQQSDAGAGIVSDASSSQKKLEISPTKTDTKFSFIQSASGILSSLPAPPAFAAEIPSKEAALQLRSLVRPSRAAHPSAGTSRTRRSRMGSFCSKKILPSGDISSAKLFPLAGVLLLKPESLMSPCFLFFILFWVLILYLGFKVGCAAFVTGR